MKILILTQDDYLYLNRFMRSLIHRLEEQENELAVATFSASPFGKKLSTTQKLLQTLEIFGFRFFIYYTILFCFRRLFTPGIVKICKQTNVRHFSIIGSINSHDNIEELAKENFDLIVSLSGNQIFKSNLLATSKYGCINLHCSQLPKYRGLMPSFWSIANGESETAATVFQVDEGIDSGPIILQQSVDITSMSQRRVILTTKEIGCNLLVEVIKLFQEGKVVYKDNPDHLSSYYGFPNREDVKKFLKSGGKFF